MLEHADEHTQKRMAARLTKEQKEKPEKNLLSVPGLLVSPRSRLNRKPKRTKKMLNPQKQEQK
tara:strand:+ start:329 stop:517 length:189 start_codon:yes stop_codon:yes gene_type:complete